MLELIFIMEDYYNFGARLTFSDEVTQTITSSFSRAESRLAFSHLIQANVKLSSRLCSC